MTDHEAELTALGATIADAEEKHNKALAARRDAIIAAYKAGWTLNAIAAAAQISKQGAQKILVTAGVQMRPRGGSLPRKTHE